VIYTSNTKRQLVAVLGTPSRIRVRIKQFPLAALYPAKRELLVVHIGRECCEAGEGWCGVRGQGDRGVVVAGMTAAASAASSRVVQDTGPSAGTGNSWPTVERQ
jgi:hypothetical protein